MISAWASKRDAAEKRLATAAKLIGSVDGAVRLENSSDETEAVSLAASAIAGADSEKGADIIADEALAGNAGVDVAGREDHFRSSGRADQLEAAAAAVAGARLRNEALKQAIAADRATSAQMAEVPTTSAIYTALDELDRSFVRVRLTAADGRSSPAFPSLSPLSGNDYRSARLDSIAMEGTLLRSQAAAAELKNAVAIAEAEADAAVLKEDLSTSLAERDAAHDHLAMLKEVRG